MYRRSLALPAAALLLASASVVYLAQTSSAQVGPGALINLNLSSANRRAPVAGLYDWTKAGYRGGADLPGAASVNPNAACQITAAELDTQYGVRPNDGTDDTTGIQAAIDAIKSGCSPSASHTRLSLLSFPAGTLDVTREIHVDADYLILRGAGSGTGGTQLVYRPDANTAYDTLTADGSDWDEDGMTSGQGKGGWLWPGRGMFRVQSRGVHSSYAADYAAAPANRKDIFEGTANVHWKVGVALRAKPGDTGFAARTGDRTIHLASSGSLANLAAGGLVNVRAANSVNFYAQQNIAPSDGTFLNQHMRQQIFTVTSVDTSNRTVTVDKPLEFDVPVDSTSDGSAAIDGTTYASKVSPLVDPVLGVGFESLSFTQDMPSLNRANATYNYGNMAPAYEMHGIVFKWAADSWVKGVRAEMTGSHPIVTEEAYHLQLVNNELDGAWNKGKGGNGYFRGSRVWDSLYAGNTSRNLRHFTFQWSASGNVVVGNDFDSDLNLHGGWERNNLFENNTATVAYQHRSASCTANCGEEGGDGLDASTWFPIWWAAGKKAVKWSGSSGPRNVFFRNTMTKQVTSGAAYTAYYPDRTRVYQFGWNGSGFRHLDIGGVPIADWAANEQRDYTGGHGVDATRTDAAPSLFLLSLSGTTPTSQPPTSSPPPTSQPPTACLRAAFSQTNTWSSGYGADYVITNNCATATTTWRLEFDLPAGTTVSSSWSSVRTRDGQHYTFTNASYNGDIQPGASETFGFNVSGLGTPLNCTVDGRSCAGGGPAPTTAPPTTAPPTTPPPTTTPPPSNGPVVNVSTAAQLRSALAAAQPGQTINLAAGTYRGSFVATVAGTASRPITLTGPSSAILVNDGPTGTAPSCPAPTAGWDSGYGLWLYNAPYWNVRGLTVAESKKGIVADNSHHTTIDGVYVHDTEDEGVHFRRSSADSVIRNSRIENAGLVQPGYGEGVYIGSANSNWSCHGNSGGVDRSDRVQVIGNRIGPGVAAESIDIKEGTFNGVIRGNTFDGRGISGQNSADSWIDAKGIGYVIEDNTGTFRSPGTFANGYETHNPSTSPSFANGCGNVWRNNRSDLGGTGNWAINVTSTSKCPGNLNVVYASNTVTNAVRGLTNIAVTP